MIQRARSVVVVIVSVATTALFVLSLVVYTQGYPLGVRSLDPLKPVMTSVMPQGWGFFTKDPTEAVWVVATIDDQGKLAMPATGRSTSVSSAFGVSRDHRVISLDQGDWLLQLSQNQVPAVECAANEIADCVDTLGDDLAYTTVEASPQRASRQNCGRHWIYMNEIKPFPYRTIEFDMEFLIYPIDVDCSAVT